MGSWPPLRGTCSTSRRSTASRTSRTSRGLSKARELRAAWQRACELLLAEADIAELSKAVELALFYDARLDVKALAEDREWWLSRYSPEDRALIESVLKAHPTLTVSEAIEHLEAAGM